MKKAQEQFDNEFEKIRQFQTLPTCDFDPNSLVTALTRHLHIYIDVYNQCNLRCKMCGGTGAFAGPPTVLEFETFRHIANSLFHRARQIGLSCAYEPLMCKDFFSYLEIAGNYDVPNITVTTNATLMTRSKAKQLVESKITHLHVSIDGSTWETYESIRVGASFDTLLNNLSYLKETKSETVKKTPEIQFQFVLMDENLHEAPEIIPLLVKFKPSRFVFIHQDYKEPSIEKRKAVETVLRRALKECVKHGVSFRELPIFCIKWEEIAKAYGKDDVEIPKLVDGCLDPWNFMIIRPNGDLLVCPGASVSEENILQTDILKIWNGKTYRKLRENWNRQRPPEMCRKCSYIGVGLVQLIDASEQLDEFIGI